MTTPAIERLLARVSTTDPDSCWTWLGAIDQQGYGVIRRGSRAADGMTSVHRLAYATLVGEIPEGMCLDHLCHTQAVERGECEGGACAHRSCCNPAHLEPVSAGENSRRGVKILALLSKTHCPQGHPYNEANTYHYKGARQCRTCRDVHRAASKARSLGGA